MEPGLDRTAFTIDTVPARVEKLGDLFAPVLAKTSFDLRKAMAGIAELVE